MKSVSPNATTTYTLTATARGFEDQVQRGLVLSAGATVNLDLRMSLGASKQTVTVSAEAPLSVTTNVAGLAFIVWSAIGARVGGLLVDPTVTRKGRLAVPPWLALEEEIAPPLAQAS